MSDRDLVTPAVTHARGTAMTVPANRPAPWCAPALPACVTPAELDADMFYPPALNRHDAPALSQAARAYSQGLRPADEAVRIKVLTALALRYPAPVRVSDAEAAARMNLLIDDLAHLPADILDSACRSAALTCRHMPTAAEIMAFARDELTARQRRAYRLDRLAREAAQAPSSAPPPSADERAGMALQLADLAKQLAVKSRR